MNRSHFEPRLSGTLGPSIDSAFFYDNRHFQEVRATLRYGVEARKGLIMFIGDAGRGKTTLLLKVIHQLDNDVTFIVESEPDVSFTALLRLMLGKLHGEVDAADRLSMLQSCKRVLRAEMDRGGTVCLIIDNAERLRDDTLECVMQNFLGAGISADRDRQLLQVILAGRPELRERLLHPRVRSLTPAPGLVCQVESLQPRDTADYIKHRLESGHLQPSAIQSEAIERIAAHAAGDLRLTNSLCSSVLALAERSSMPKITVELVGAAARDLGLAPSRPPERPAAKVDSEIPNDRDEPFSFQLGDGDTTQVVGQTFLNYHDNEPQRLLRRSERDRSAVRVFLFVLVIGVAFLWLRDQLGNFPLHDWGAILRALAGSSSPPSSPAPSSEPAPPPATAQIEPSPAPAKDDAPAQHVDENVTQPQLSESASEPGPVSLPEKPAKRQLANQPKAATKPAPLPPRNEARASENPEIQDKKLEMEIYRAIENRAIIGVAVRVSDGSVYLDGQVATERQKRAAERAARSVDGIERVHNRIRVS